MGKLCFDFIHVRTMIDFFNVLWMGGSGSCSCYSMKGNMWQLCAFFLLFTFFNISFLHLCFLPIHPSLSFFIFNILNTFGFHMCMLNLTFGACRFSKSYVVTYTYFLIFKSVFTKSIVRLGKFS